MKTTVITRALVSTAALLALLDGVAAAQCPSNDAFEPNDTCATATPLTSGAYDAVMTDYSEYDYYSFVVPAGGGLQLDSLSDDWGSVADLGFTLYAGADCAGGVLEDEIAGFAHAQLHWVNTTGSAQPVTLRVRAAFVHAGIQCVNYTLDVAVVSPACEVAAVDDMFDENDRCPEAAIIGDGLWRDLYLSFFDLAIFNDRDYYKLAVHPGETLAVDVLFDHALADLDLVVYAGIAQCEEQAATPFVAEGTTTAAGESAVWVNDTGLTWTAFIRVWHGSLPVDGCGLYDLSIARFDTGIGASYCFGDGTAGASCPCGNASSAQAGCLNSRGHGAILSANGTASVANDDLSFRVTNGAPNQPFLLLQGATVIALPFKDGVLCMGNPTRRLEVVFMDGAGTGATIESVVTNGAVLPGQTRQYQAWYRDPLSPAPCTARSNLTQALELVWE